MRSFTQRRRFGRDERGVSDIVGSILLVAITIISGVALGGMIFAFPGPPETTIASLRTSLIAGAGGWGTGDESIQLTHLGGESLSPLGLSITYSINNVATTLSGASQLGSVLNPGPMVIGQTWVRTAMLRSTDIVSVSVAVQGSSGSSLVASAPNLSPLLFNAVCGPSPTYVQAAGLASTVGTLTNAAGAIAAAGTEASLVEVGATNAVVAGTTTTGTSGTLNPSNALLLDAQRATMQAPTDVLDVNGFSLPGSPGIRQVILGFQGMKSAAAGTTPTTVLSYLVSGVAGPTTSTVTVAATADTAYTIDVTNDRSWSQADINGLTVQLASGQFGSGANLRTILVDQLYVQVVYSPPTGVGQALNAQVSFPCLPTGTTQTVDLGYRITPVAANDVFNVQVWNGATWRTCAGQLTNVLPTPVAFTCALVLPAEFNNGSPLVRILDANPASTTQTTLLLDYARVNTT
jgi:flagellin-like protein